MDCSTCCKHLDITWLFCAHCGTKIDRARGMDVNYDDIEDFLKARKNTLDVLKQIIDELEYYGKLQISCNLASGGAKIVLGILGLTVPGTSIAGAVYIAASVLIIAKNGALLLKKWKENELLKRAEKICKIDNDKHREIWIDIAVVLSGNLPASVCKMKNTWGGYEDGAPINSTYKNILNILTTIAAIRKALQDCKRLSEGKFCSVAEKLRLHLERLQEEYDILTCD